MYIFSYLKNILIVPVYDFIMKSFFVPWRYYCKKKCIDSGVSFEGEPLFNGRCILSISRDSVVRIGVNFVVNSGYKYCIDTVSFSKIDVLGGGILTNRE